MIRLMRSVVGGVGEVNCLEKAVAIFFLIGEVSVDEWDGLVGDVGGSLPVESPEKSPEV